MLALVVPAQIHFTLKALGTNVTSKRFEACVFPAVGDQIGALAERFTTHLAFVGFFTCEIKHTHTKKNSETSAQSKILYQSVICIKVLSATSGESGLVSIP